jgi:hypothetical protein
MKEKGISIFFPFRSFHNQEFNQRLFVFFLIPVVFNLIILLLLKNITQFWSEVINFFLSKLSFDFNILYTQYFLFDFSFLVPSIDLSASVPDAMNWWSYIVVSVIVFLLSFLIPDKYTPLIYYIRSFIMMLWFTLIFCFFYPASFPYKIALFTKTGFLQIISLLFATPWIYCLTYYMFGYRVVRKIIISSLALIYFIILAPFQYMMSACLINLYSVALMPALYIYAGLMINIFAAVALFAYGVSLEQIYTKYKK